MPVSRPLLVTILSAGILLGSVSIVKAHSHLPGCAHAETKDLVIELVVKDIKDDIRKYDRTEYTMIMYGDAWKLDAFSLTNIVLTDYNEHTGILTCRATLRGKRDREMWERVIATQPGYNADYAREKNIRAGYWDEQDLNHIQYTVSQSAEQADYFVVTLYY